MSLPDSTSYFAPAVKARRGPAGIQLFDRQTGLNVLLDEIDIPEATWDKAPRHISIALTNACNLHCTYCYAPKNSAAQSYSDLVAWVDELETNGCLGIGFGGGEPMLYPRLPEICRHVTEHTAMAVTLTTHGHNLTDRLTARLEGAVHFIRVSVDGVGKTYERLRGKRFADLERHLKVIKSLAPFGLNVVVNSYTVGELDAITEFAAASGARELLLLPEVKTQSCTGIDPQTRMAMLAWIRTYGGSVPLAMSEGGAEQALSFTPLSAETGLSAYAHIDAVGAIKKSSFDRVGVRVDSDGVIAALKSLSSQLREETS